MPHVRVLFSVLHRGRLWEFTLLLAWSSREEFFQDVGVAIAGIIK